MIKAERLLMRLMRLRSCVTWMVRAGRSQFSHSQHRSPDTSSGIITAECPAIFAARVVEELRPTYIPPTLHCYNFGRCQYSTLLTMCCRFDQLLTHFCKTSIKLSPIFEQLFSQSIGIFLWRLSRLTSILSTFGITTFTTVIQQALLQGLWSQ